MACPVVDRRGGIFNRGFNPSRRIRTQSMSVPRSICLTPSPWGLERFARGALNNSEDFGEGFANGFFSAQPVMVLHEIEIGILRNIGTKNASPIELRVTTARSCSTYNASRRPCVRSHCAARAIGNSYRVALEEIIMRARATACFARASLTLPPRIRIGCRARR